jgi:hypothetical protein
LEKLVRKTGLVGRGEEKALRYVLLFSDFALGWIGWVGFD